MLSYDQVQEILTGLTDKLPDQLFEGLNGGILLLPDTKQHPESVGDSLYILGEYHYDPMGFGRYILIYYGSFCQTRGGSPYREQVDKLREVLHHELTHHLEHLAGDLSLERQDACVLAEYRQRYSR